MLVLSIMHNIFLSKEEIEKLLVEKEIETIGVSIPVWYYKRSTSEPAEEVFCKYKLKITDKKESVSVLKNGYVINLQIIPEDYVEKILTAKEMETMTNEEVNEWQTKNPRIADISKLLKDDGRTNFRQFAKKKQNGHPTNLVHVVEFNQINTLIKSMI
jgi:hypothetical protein